MKLSNQEYSHIVEELSHHLRAHRDGSGKNLIVPQCPFCGKRGGKFGIYIGAPTTERKPLMAHCFSCGMSTHTPEQLLAAVGRMDLMVLPTGDIGNELINILGITEEREVDDTLCEVKMPDFYKRTFNHPYLKQRGLGFDDYEYFLVGATGKLNRRYEDYVIFPIIDEGRMVGYVSRYTWSKTEIDRYNRKAKRTGVYKILRYRNSTENNFSKLLYNYDAVYEDETRTVILVEGIFDVIALTRKLNLYDNRLIAAVASFGKKISDVQIYKLQRKGVRTVIVGYDGDAVTAIKRTADRLRPYFLVFVADIADAHKDWDDMTQQQVRQTFRERIFSALEYKLRKVQQL